MSPIPLFSSMTLPQNPLFIALLIICSIFSGIVMYSYMAISLSLIAKHLGKGPAWWAWVPIFNVLLLLRLAGKPLWWIFLFLLPLVNIIFAVILYSEIAKALDEPSWLGILILIPIVNALLPGYLAYRAKKSVVPFVLFGITILFAIVTMAFAFYVFFSTNGKDISSFFPSTPASNTQKMSNLGGPMYTNEPYGFSLSMTPAWAGYRADDAQSSDEFATAQLRFYYVPMGSAGSPSVSNKIGMNLFVIDIYPIENWYWVKAQCELGQIPLCGEEIGTNDSYAFVFSQINGDPPVDVDPRVRSDLTKIMKSFTPLIPQKKLTNDELQALRTDRLNRFRDVSIEYQNCKHGYVISYPTSFSNNGMTADSDLAIIDGMGLTITIEATYNSRGMTLADFAGERLKTIKGKEDGKLETKRNEIPFILYQFTEPRSSVSFWQKGAWLYEIRYDGTNYDGTRRVVKNISGTLNANAILDSCAGTATQTTGTGITNTAPTVEGCNHPNGDVEYWWNDVSQDIRDCYIRLYGWPSFALPDPGQGDMEADHPNGDIENW